LVDPFYRVPESEFLSLRRSPQSPWPDGTLRLALVRLSRVIDFPASTTFLNDVPRALRRTKSLLVLVSIS
jgi:hypothetical protein